MRWPLLAVLLLVAVLFSAGPVESQQKVIVWDRTAPLVSSFTSGTLALALERGGGDTSPGPLFYATSFEGQTPDGRPGLLPTGLLAPGDTIHRILLVRNTGTLDAFVTSVSAELTDGSRALADQLQLVVTTDAAGANPVVWGPLSEFLARPQLLDGAPELKAGEAVSLHFWVRLPLETSNLYQGLRCAISFAIGAEQRQNNTPPPPPVKPPQLG